MSKPYPAGDPRYSVPFDSLDRSKQEKMPGGPRNQISGPSKPKPPTPPKEKK